MDKAFVLGAGLGTRLRPLTDQLPKPLIPFFNRPLITRAFDHLLGAGVREFIVNTHHLPECYAAAFPRNAYRGARITFRHEPVLLETAGGIANIADLVKDASFIVYNGDVLTDLPLVSLLRTHAETGNLVTLVLRSVGPAKHVAFDAGRGLVTDIRGKIGTGNMGTHQFTGIYAVSPAFLKRLTPGKIESVVSPWLEAIEQRERIGAVVVNEGQWWDLGDRESYLDAHRALLSPDERPVSPEASVDPTAVLKGLNVISATASVGPKAVLEDCILWEGAKVAKGARLKRCIVRRGMEARGVLKDGDV
jgi:mannose-1-phosphate guanylyltransferase/mannose-1-phosphate guanylyltransferase/phosphomannomutase